MLCWLLRGSTLPGQLNEGDGPRIPQSRVTSAASMMLRTCLGYALGFLLASVFFAWQAHGLQCYGCNIIQERRYVDVGCSNPEVMTCSDSHKGFKHRFCLKTESTALGIVLTSGCATSRHCQQQELPGVRIHCCDSDLCNTAPCCRASALHYLCALAVLILFSLWL